MVNEATNTSARKFLQSRVRASKRWNGFCKQKPVPVSQEDLQWVELMGFIQFIKGKWLWRWFRMASAMGIRGQGTNAEVKRWCGLQLEKWCGDAVSSGGKYTAWGYWTIRLSDGMGKSIVYWRTKLNKKVECNSKPREAWIKREQETMTLLQKWGRKSPRWGSRKKRQSQQTIERCIITEKSGRNAGQTPPSSKESDTIIKLG